MSYFYQKKKTFPVILYLPILLLAMVLIWFICFSDSFSKTNSEQEKQFLENAIERGITQCYALEGAYPVSLSYLTEHYGLHYNQEHFFVDYQYIGSNLRPDVTVIERN